MYLEEVLPQVTGGSAFIKQGGGQVLHITWEALAKIYL